VRFVWDWFCELQSSTDKVLTFTEILAWSQLTGRDLTPLETTTLRLLSKDFLTLQNHE